MVEGGSQYVVEPELIEYLDTRKEVVGEYKLIVVVILLSVV
jgi:hypothetical protein